MEGRRIVLEYDQKISQTGDLTLAQKANEELAEMAKKTTTDVLGKVLKVASEHMRNGYSRADH